MSASTPPALIRTRDLLDDDYQVWELEAAPGLVFAVEFDEDGIFMAAWWGPGWCCPVDVAEV